MLQKEHNALIVKFYEDVERLGFKSPVADISGKTGYAKGNISSILNKKIQPSEAFLKKFYESFKDEISNMDVQQEPQPTTANNNSNQEDYRIKYERLLERTNAEQSAIIMGVLQKIDANLTNAANNQHIFHVMTTERQRVTLENMALLRGLNRNELVHEADSIGVALLDAEMKMHTVSSDTSHKSDSDSVGS